MYYWGEPERAPYGSKWFPRDLSIYLSIYLSMYLCMRTSFRKCPHVLFHRQFKFTFAHCTCTNRVWAWASERLQTTTRATLNKRTAELCPGCMNDAYCLFYEELRSATSIRAAETKSKHRKVTVRATWQLNLRDRQCAVERTLHEGP